MTKREMDNAAERAADVCNSRHKGLHEFQDCLQGVNTMRRMMRKASPKTAARAAAKLCNVNEKYPGPRSRCRSGVRTLVVELKRRR